MWSQNINQDLKENVRVSIVGPNSNQNSVNIAKSIHSVRSSVRVSVQICDEPVAGTSRSRSQSPAHRVNSVIQRVGPNDFRHRLNNVRVEKPVVINTRIMCYNCGGNHPVRKCERFRTMKLMQILDQLNHLNLCNNCLGHLEQNDQHNCPHRHCHRCGNRVFHNSIICPRNPENFHKL